MFNGSIVDIFHLQQLLYDQRKLSSGQRPTSFQLTDVTSHPVASTHFFFFFFSQLKRIQRSCSKHFYKPLMVSKVFNCSFLQLLTQHSSSHCDNTVHHFSLVHTKCIHDHIFQTVFSLKLHQTLYFLQVHILLSNCSIYPSKPPK